MRDYSFGNFLHQLRTRSGLTQFQLGALVGVSDKAVSKWENGSAKPQSGILSKLGEVLGVSVDELLSCKYHSPSPSGVIGVFAMKKQLWNKALFALRDTYGEVSPTEILNRYLTEQAELEDTDMIVYWDMLAGLTAEAKKYGEHLRLRGGVGASLVAYLLGATDVNPLPPHRYCPVCHRVEFDDTVCDGWDLPSRICTCGATMEGDGHGIPFETYRHVVRRNTSFDLSVSPDFFEGAKAFVESYFRDCDLLPTAQTEQGTVSFSVKSPCSSCTVTLCADEEFGRYKRLEQKTGVAFGDVPFRCPEIPQAFASGDTVGIPEFRTGMPKEILRAVSPAGFGELIQILGLSHGTGTWTDNGELLVKEGKGIQDIIAYRDDVFRVVRQALLKKRIADTGCAYKIMEDTRKGRYVANKMTDAGRVMMLEMGLEEWFLESISKIRYLFPKAYGVTCVRIAAILMWYKINYPTEFESAVV